MTTKLLARRVTFARRRCTGCGRTTAIHRWPWNGRVLVTTHGLCQSCCAALMAGETRRVARFRLPERAVVSDLLN